MCAALCMFGGGIFTRDAAVIEQLHAVVLPVCAAVVANIVSKSMYGVTVAAKQLGFLATITAGWCKFKPALKALGTSPEISKFLPLALQYDMQSSSFNGRFCG
jgi:hypothetical protein